MLSVTTPTATPVDVGPMALAPSVSPSSERSAAPLTESVVE